MSKKLRIISVSGNQVQLCSQGILKNCVGAAILKTVIYDKSECLCCAISVLVYSCLLRYLLHTSNNEHNYFKTTAASTEIAVANFLIAHAPTHTICCRHHFSSSRLFEINKQSIFQLLYLKRIVLRRKRRFRDTVHLEVNFHGIKP